MISGWAHPPDVLAPLAEKMPALSPVELFSASGLQREDTGASSGTNEGAAPSEETQGNAELSEVDQAHLPARTRKLGSAIETANAPAVLVGWSTGAMFALETAVAYPDHVVALVLLSGTACFHQTETCPWGTRQATLRVMERRLGSKPEPVLDDFFRRSAAPRKCSDEDIDHKIDFALAEERKVLQEGLMFLRDSDLTPLLSRVRQPCLLMHGKQDTIIAPQAMNHLHARLRRSATVSIAYAGHALPEQETDTVAIYSNQFLEGLP